MNIFFTFAFNIGRVPEPILVRALHCLVNSLNYFKNNYILIVYTNIPDLEDDSLSPHIRIVPYDTAKIPQVYPENRWWSMSFHKLTMASAVAAEYSDTPIWIDLDTIVCRNVDHLAALPNFFIQHGTTDRSLDEVLPGQFIWRSLAFQGNIWKIDGKLLHDLLDLWNTLPVKPHYDAQGLFNVAYHFNGFNDRMHCLDTSVINSLEAWSSSTAVSHPSVKTLKEIIIQDGNIIHSPTGKPIQFLSFTFETLSMFFTTTAFTSADPTLHPFLKACGYF